MLLQFYGFGCLAILTSVIWFGFMQPGRSQTALVLSNNTIEPSMNHELLISQASTGFTFQFPPTGAPGNRGDAASRPDVNPIVLVPITNVGQTFSFPTFWIYISPQLTFPATAELILRDAISANRSEIYRATFPITQRNGIIGLQVDDTTLSLMPQRYEWSLDVAGSLLYGSFDIVAPNPQLQNQLAQVPRKHRVEIYAANGLWFETVTELMLGRCEGNDSILDIYWRRLLAHEWVDLPDLAGESLLSCSNIVY